MSRHTLSLLALAAALLAPFVRADDANQPPANSTPANPVPVAPSEPVGTAPSAIPIANPGTPFPGSEPTSAPQPVTPNVTGPNTPSIAPAQSLTPGRATPQQPVSSYSRAPGVQEPSVGTYKIEAFLSHLPLESWMQLCKSRGLVSTDQSAQVLDADAAQGLRTELEALPGSVPLSSPKIITLEGQPATVQVGQQIAVRAEFANVGYDLSLIVRRMPDEQLDLTITARVRDPEETSQGEADRDRFTIIGTTLESFLTIKDNSHVVLNFNSPQHANQRTVWLLHVEQIARDTVLADSNAPQDPFAAQSVSSPQPGNPFGAPGGTGPGVQVHPGQFNPIQFQSQGFTFRGDSVPTAPGAGVAVDVSRPHGEHPSNRAVAHSGIAWLPGGAAPADIPLRVVPLEESGQVIRLCPGQTLWLQQAESIRSVEGFNPKCIQVQPASPTKLKVSGGELGTTPMSITDAEGEVRHLTIIVQQDVSEIELLIKQYWPTAVVTVIPVGHAILLRGTVEHADHMQEISEVVQLLSPQVLNQLRVSTPPATEATADNHLGGILTDRHAGLQKLALPVSQPGIAAIKVADRVDLFGIPADSTPDHTRSIRLAQNVEVVAVQQKSSSDLAIVALLVTPAQVRAISEFTGEATTFRVAPTKSTEALTPPQAPTAPERPTQDVEPTTELRNDIRALHDDVRRLIQLLESRVPEPAPQVSPLGDGSSLPNPNTSPESVLFFSAAWCGPCQRMAPLVLELSTTEIPIVTVNIDEHPELAREYQIDRIPTFIRIGNGKELARSVGLLSRKELGQFISQQASSDPRAAAVTISVERADETNHGSGFIVRDGQGRLCVMTAAHLLRDLDTTAEVSVWCPALGDRYVAKLLEQDSDADIALLKIEDAAFQQQALPIEFSDQTLLVGASVQIVGFEHRAAALSKTPRLATGKIVSRDKYQGTANFEIGDFVAAQGMSGAMVLDEAGRLCGVVTAVDPEESSTICTALAPVQELLTLKTLGLQFRPLPKEDQAFASQPYRGGLLVTEVAPRSLARNAGLQPGDILVGLGFYEVTTQLELNYALNARSKRPHEPLKFYLLRNGETIYGTIPPLANSPHETGIIKR